MRGKKRPATERMHALSIAAVEGSEEASRRTGIPATTIQTWMEKPEFVGLREKTREELAEGFRTMAHLAMTRLMEAMQRNEVEPRDLAVALGIATDKHLLMSGHATARTESRALGDDLDDHERAALKAVLAETLAEGEVAGSDPGAGVDAGTAPDPA